MEAASDCYCRCCKKLFNREGKKHCVNLFGEKGLKEGIVDNVRKYASICSSFSSIFNPSSSNADEIARLNEFSDIELAIFPSEMRNFK